MSWRKLFGRVGTTLAAITTFLLLSCSKPSPNVLLVGTISGPETDIMQTAQKIAKERYGVTIKIVEFNDYNLPNEALQNGSLDANVYQHLPYLTAASKAHGYNFTILGKTFIYPVGLYSKKVKSLQELPAHATIALPNDPSNETRALALLQAAKLITIKDDGNASLADITSNPHKLVFHELDAAQLPRVLDDVDAAVINTNFAIPSGLTPSKDAIFLEGKDSPYANLIVARKDSPKTPQLEALVKALHSVEVQNTAHELFGEGAIPAW